MIIRCLFRAIATLASLLLFPLLLGCDSSPAPVAKPSKAATASTPAVVAPVAPPKPKVNFASVDAGVAAFKEAAAARDGDRIAEITHWLVAQGNAAVAPLGQLANDSAAEAGTRVGATRALAMIGGDAATTQLITASKSKEAVVRAKAAESLGSLRPATTPMLDQLIVLLDDKNHQVKAAAIRSIKRLGTQAERAAPKLQAMLNSDAEEEHRKEAHAALKQVAPRIGFRQGELDE